MYSRRPPLKASKGNYRRYGHLSLLAIALICTLIYLLKTGRFSMNGDSSGSSVLPASSQPKTESTNAEVEISPLAKKNPAATQKITASREPEPRPAPAAHYDRPYRVNKEEQKKILEKKKAIVSLVILNSGMNQLENRLLLTIPNHVTLGFTPYAPNLGQLIKRAVLRGFDAIIHLPTKTTNDKNIDSGPLMLSHELSPDENSRRIQRIIDMSPGIVGLYLDENQTITDSPIFKKVVEPEIESNLLYLGYWFIRRYKEPKLYNNGEDDDNNVITSESQIRFDTILDDDLDPQEMKENITKLVRQSIALNQPVVGVIRSYPMSIKVLKEWLRNNHDNQDIIFITLNNLVELNRR